MVDQAKSPDVIADSEEEQELKSKANVSTAKDADATAPGSEKGGENESGEESEEGDGGEFEIEAILDAKHGAFSEGRMGYLVKWKGYGEEENCWIPETDATNCQELIDEFWARTKKERNKPKTPKSARRRKSNVSEAKQDTDKKRKKAFEVQKSKIPQGDNNDSEMDNNEDKPHKKRRSSEIKPKDKPKDSSPIANDGMEVDDETDQYVAIPDKYRKQANWEGIVKSIDTIERREGSLKVFFTLQSGSKVFESSAECAKKFPQKLIKFYESHLRWKELDS